MTMKKFEMTIGGEHLKWEEKSYAANFRNFWNHFLDKDVEKSLEVVALTNIRISDNEFFVAQNGSKKKNIPAKEGVWIYTHLTPQAMEKVYEKFAAGWEGRYVTKEVAPVTPDDLTAQPETDDDLTPTHVEPEKKLTPKEIKAQKAAAAVERQRLAKEAKAQKAAERKAAKDAKKIEEVEQPEQGPQQLTAEDIENVQL